MTKRTNVVYLRWDSYYFTTMEGKRWDVSPLLEDLIRELTRDNTRPFIRVSTEESPVHYGTTMDLVAKRTWPGFDEEDHICFYAKRHHPWSVVATICEEALVYLFGRVPKQLIITTSETPHDQEGSD